ncbi:tRNA(Met) cytidine acetyltransferase TmcA [Motilimonas sp. KMU-193]|uniref:tRNA(Met) cytidine acetyltransferase TmcA n=1 Tax=Motilimonas sp. KMU-193 TaxID=3388668 RepID=UPI00396B37BE
MTLKPIYQQLKQFASTSQHRYLLVLSGEQAWAWQQVIDLLEPNALIVGQLQPDHSASLAQTKLDYTLCQAKQASHYLGQTRQQVIYDAFQGFSADAVGAVSGTLIGGGIMVLIVPPIQDWPTFNDPDYLRFLSADAPIPTESLFLRRWRDLLKQHPAVTVIEQHQPLPKLKLTQPMAISHTPCIAPCLSHDQAQAVNAIMRVKQGRSHRPLIISADRGRGKSASLGIAAAQLMAPTNKISIIVTAPTLPHTRTTFELLKQLQPEAKHSSNQVLLGESHFSFYAPDQLLNQLPQADLLLVDEAAALPLPLLKQLDQHYPRVVYATTLHGYEGSGRGFSLKFLPYLQQHNASVHQQHLSQPIRWASQDPLEAFIFDALLLDAQLPVADGQLPSADKATMEIVSAAELCLNETQLREVFALLVSAHYQTKPSDLRAILDNPELTIALLKQNETLLGAALISREGQLSQPLAEQVYLGQRRPQGHLLPQVLLYQAGFSHIHGDKFARVMRIAIHPQWQQLGLGTVFYQYLKQWAQQQHFDWLGTSFGLTTELGRFWHRQGMHFVHLGLSQDSASGCFSAVMLQPLTSHKELELNHFRSLFCLQLECHLTGRLQHLSADIAGFLIATLPKKPAPPHLLQQITDFAQHPRPFEACLPSLKLWLLQHTDSSRLPALHQAILVESILQQQLWPQVIKNNGLTGKKSAEQLLKQSINQLLQR